MKRNCVALTAVVAFLFAALSLSHQATAQNAARATIPFGFVANHQVLPAGCYKVELQSHSYLQLVNCETGRVVGLLVSSVGAHQEIGSSSLLFRLADGGYRLSQVRFAYSNLQTDLAVQPRPERELAGNAPGRNIEIAMK